MMSPRTCFFRSFHERHILDDGSMKMKQSSNSSCYRWDIKVKLENGFFFFYICMCKHMQLGSLWHYFRYETITNSTYVNTCKKCHTMSPIGKHRSHDIMPPSNIVQDNVLIITFLHILNHRCNGKIQVDEICTSVCFCKK